ncbi:hypothetical protein NADFUDRAFT_50182 [Nadsonia fulvescens var. elongata DSM 6958]|uniref:RING-type domain-containing protein n=1 Tax=Nadsonia fulvescens var. elongata DSM 6958 TaxID=857566 RepID=A0A1E3PLE5_9ASCO|nr:hypothetical protein NADFUDRAFT_50182 [Nadsonia fulvescens var. elongata DSM 6958]
MDLSIRSVSKGITQADALTTLDNFQQSLTCPVCQELMYTPCLTECGHLFCYNCLFEWLRPEPNQPRATLRAEDSEPDLEEELDTGSTPAVKTTCPACRKKLHNAPVFSHSHRALVDHLLHLIVQSTPPLQRQDIDDQIRSFQGDSTRLYDHHLSTPDKGGLFEGIFSSRGPAWIDVEDRVRRCGGCLWEITPGEHACARCGQFVLSDEEGEGDLINDDDDEDVIGGNNNVTSDEGEADSEDDAFLDQRDTRAILNDRDASEDEVFFDDEDEEPRVTDDEIRSSDDEDGLKSTGYDDEFPDFGEGSVDQSDYSDGDDDDDDVNTTKSSRESSGLRFGGRRKARAPVVLSDEEDDTPTVISDDDCVGSRTNKRKRVALISDDED